MTAEMDKLTEVLSVVNETLAMSTKILSKINKVGRGGKAVKAKKAPKEKEGKRFKGTSVSKIGNVYIYSEVLDKLGKDEVTRKDIISTLMKVCKYKKNTANQISSAYSKHLKSMGIIVIVGKRGRPVGATGKVIKKKRTRVNTDSTSGLTLLEVFENTKIWKEVIDALPEKPEKSDMVNTLVEKVGYKRTTARTMAQRYVNYLGSKKK